MYLNFPKEESRAVIVLNKLGKSSTTRMTLRNFLAHLRFRNRTKRDYPELKKKYVRAPKQNWKSSELPKNFILNILNITMRLIVMVRCFKERKFGKLVQRIINLEQSRNGLGKLPQNGQKRKE